MNFLKKAFSPSPKILRHARTLCIDGELMLKDNEKSFISAIMDNAYDYIYIKDCGVISNILNAIALSKISLDEMNISSKIRKPRPHTAKGASKILEAIAEMTPDPKTTKSKALTLKMLYIENCTFDLKDLNALKMTNIELFAFDKIDTITDATCENILKFLSGKLYMKSCPSLSICGLSYMKNFDSISIRSMNNIEYDVAYGYLDGRLGASKCTKFNFSSDVSVSIMSGVQTEHNIAPKLLNNLEFYGIEPNATDIETISTPSKRSICTNKTIF